MDTADPIEFNNNLAQEVTQFFSFDKFGELYIGITNAERLRVADKASGVLSKDGLNYRAEGQGLWGNVATTASSLQGVLNDGLFNDFDYLMFKGQPFSKLTLAMIEGNKEDALNLGVTTLKKAYAKFSKAHHNAPRKIAQKGFDQYAIDTMQTYNAITGWNCK